jgi:hypothetical protein
MIRALQLNWRGILQAVCLVVSINLLCINWLVVIDNLKDNELEIVDRFTSWSSCVLRAGASTSECQTMANNIIPVWRGWVLELFTSLTGVEAFLIEGTQKYVRKFKLIDIGDSGLDGQNYFATGTILCGIRAEGKVWGALAVFQTSDGCRQTVHLVLMPGRQASYTFIQPRTWRK